MRIRTATAAALLATAAVLGSAGTAFADNNTHWNSFVQDFSDHILSKRVNKSDNDTTIVKRFENTNVSDNVLKNNSAGLAIGDLDLR